MKTSFSEGNFLIKINNLTNEIKQCSLCESELPLPPKPIIQFSINSKILIAGQAPGLVTHHKGVPFDDLSGDRLRTWLGVSKEAFYNANYFAIVPMGLCYPGKGKTGDIPPLPICAKTWRSKILSQLKKVELTVLVGKYAIEWHLNTKSPITELASHWQQLLKSNQIVIPHPSPRNNRWLKNNLWFEDEVIPHLRQQVKQVLRQE